MSAPFAKLPNWAEYGLIPVVNLVVAFLVVLFGLGIAVNLCLHVLGVFWRTVPF